MDAPNRIWAWPHFDGWITGDWSANTYHDDRTVEYILAAEHDRVVAEKDAEIARLKAERDEALRRRDGWRAKAEGYDAVRLALREKVGTPWPPHMSRLLWAGIAADEKKRADDAASEIARLHDKLFVAWTVIETLRARLETARNDALDDAARMVDCACECRDAALAAKTKVDRWNACGRDPCGALDADDIRAMKD